MKSRRELIDKTLKEYKDKRLARKRGRDDYESEMLGIARGESNLRNKMFVHIEKMDKLQTEKMSKLTTTMETLSNSIAAGFSMLRQLLQPPFQQPTMLILGNLHQICVSQIHHHHSDSKPMVNHIHLQLVRNLTGIKPPKWTNKTSDPKQPSSYVCIPPF